LNGPVDAVTSSQFYRIVVGTSILPIDVAGGTTVILQAQGDIVRIGTTPSQDNYFSLMDSFGAAGPVPPLTVPSTDERLYVRADSGTAVLSIWVVR